MGSRRLVAVICYFTVSLQLELKAANYAWLVMFGDALSDFEKPSLRRDWWKWLLSIAPALIGLGLLSALFEHAELRDMVSNLLMSLAFLTPLIWMAFSRYRYMRSSIATVPGVGGRSGWGGTPEKRPRRWPAVVLASVVLFFLSVMVATDSEMESTDEVLAGEENQLGVAEPSSSSNAEDGPLADDGSERPRVGDVGRTGDPLSYERAPYQLVPDFSGGELCSIVDVDLAESIDISGPFRSSDGSLCISDGLSLEIRAAVEEDEGAASLCALEAAFSFLDILDHEPFSYNLNGSSGRAEVDSGIGTSVAGWNIGDHCFQVILHTIPNPQPYSWLRTGATRDEIVSFIDDIVDKSTKLVGD